MLILILLILSSPLAGAQRPPVLAFVSDTQAPMWIEDVYLHSNQNIRATGMIFDDIVAQRPTALFILGDVVSKGYRKRKWTRIDAYIKLCRDSGIYVTATLGNHDVMTKPAKGESEFQKRFVEHIRTGYVKVIDSVAVVLLNSNFDKLAEADQRIQSKWLEEMLEKLDHDPGIYTTIVACHHSPFSNSKITGYSSGVQKQFVPLFMQSRKCRMFLSGHSHNFELFSREGKQFIVIGGGGGLSQPLSNKPDGFDDQSKDYKPMFHYLQVRRGSKGLEVTSRFLKDDFSGLEIGKTLTIGY